MTRHFEDFSVGDIHDLGSVTVARDEIVDFARQFDPQSFHLDEAQAAASPYGGLIASGRHTGSLSMRLLAEGLILDSASQGSPGLDYLKWLKPVHPGDTLAGRAEVVAARGSRSRPDRGLVTLKVVLANQDGVPVLELQAPVFFGRRPAAPA